MIHSKCVIFFKSCMTISDDDTDLFRAAIGPVRPLKHTAATTMARRKPPLARLRKRIDPAHSAKIETPFAPDETHLTANDQSSFRKNSVHPQVFHRLKKGLVATQDEIDLHGATVMQAEIMLLRFLAHAHVQGYRCVRIIHGKGRQSESSYPPLKNLVDRLLRRDRWVLAFHSTPRAQGGTGAVCVLLSHRHY